MNILYADKITLRQLYVRDLFVSTIVFIATSVFLWLLFGYPNSFFGVGVGYIACFVIQTGIFFAITKPKWLIKHGYQK